MGKFHQFLTELAVCHKSVFKFLDDKLIKYKLILTKLASALIFWRSGLELLMGKFHQFLTE